MILFSRTAPLVLAISDIQSALNPAGEQGASIARLWWIYFWVLTAIFILVAVFIFLAMLPRRKSLAEEARSGRLPEPSAPQERSLAKVVIGGVIASIVVLFVLLFVDFFAGRSIYALNDQNTGGADALTIKITGH